MFFGPYSVWPTVSCGCQPAVSTSALVSLSLSLAGFHFSRQVLGLDRGRFPAWREKQSRPFDVHAFTFRTQENKRGGGGADGAVRCGCKKGE